MPRPTGFLSLDEPRSRRSLQSLALRGSAWTIAGFGASQVLRLAGNLVLTRILFPEAFGVAALVWLFLQGLAMFSDVGIGPSLVRSPRGDDPRFVNTAWTIQVGRGLILWLCSALIAWPVSQIYGVPHLVWLLPVAGATAAIQGFNSTSISICTRRLFLGRLSLLELVAQAIALAATVSLALSYPSVWSLIFGAIISSLVTMILSHRILAGPPNRFRWDSDARKEIHAFGRWIFLNSVVTFIAMQIDRVVLGRLIPIGEFGIYAIAASLAQVPRDVVLRLSGSVIFPLVSAVRHHEGGFDKIKRARRLLLLASGAGCTILFFAAPALVGVLLDRRYRAAGPILRMLAIGTWLQTISATYSSVLMAAGRPKFISAGLILRLGIFLMLAKPVFHRFGVLGVAALTALSEIGVVIATVYGEHKVTTSGGR